MRGRYETLKPHLPNNAGVRASSCSRDFAATGAYHFCLVVQGKVQHWVRFPDGLAVRNES